jgi:hypothetical protein
VFGGSFLLKYSVKDIANTAGMGDLMLYGEIKGSPVGAGLAT